MTRRISRKPAAASGQTCIELIASALSKLSLSNGKLSTAAPQIHPSPGYGGVARQPVWIEALLRRCSRQVGRRSRRGGGGRNGGVRARLARQASTAPS